jgi:OOP family OmpA-OmpF porin
MKKFIFNLLLCTSLFAQTYEYGYKVVDQNKSEIYTNDFFMYGDFEQIIRFEPLVFQSDSELTEDSEGIYKDALEKINELKEKNDKFYVTVIGHTDTPTDDLSEVSIDSDTYANAIQNVFRYSLDTNDSKEISKNYASVIKHRLIDDEVDENITFSEFRSGNENNKLETYDDTRELNNRVMLTIYVEYALKDSDGDGVYDHEDKCPDTPKGVEVDEVGCPLDTDGDGVYDYKDRCPNTPKGVEVDKHGCPLDTDGDGVLDYKDECPTTPYGLKVDQRGCPIFKSLALNYKTASAEILESSMPKVLEFAEFMKKYTAYKAKIIGHTDSVGKEKSNLTLSKARAKSVRDALVAEGIDPKRLQTDGKGEYEPIASNKTKDGRRQNRRIEVQLFE